MTRTSTPCASTIAHDAIGTGDAVHRRIRRRTPRSAPGLIPYFTAGYPHLDSLGALLLCAQRSGCIAAEVGIPFSDPLADGPTIQRTGQVALSNGMTAGHALEQVRDCAYEPA